MIIGLKYYLIFCIVMFLISFSVDSMNMMVYSLNDLYISKSLIISSLFMTSNMLWGHQIVHYLSKGHLNKSVLFIGLLLSTVLFYIMRTQMFIKPNDWLKEMIPHHSIALTTTTQLLKNNDISTKSDIYKLASTILTTQQNEIITMKNMLK